MEGVNIRDSEFTKSATELDLNSIALARLVEEVRNNAVSAPSAYNRMHNRHNR
ncbi:YhhA family cyclophane-containing RiPP [Acetobacter syzygii]|uniref:YhhA family cyclophane-containing RiPP n=1 Tax=Acetobacter syzygii TaxID=146476 RepID=UPI0039E8BC93